MVKQIEISCKCIEADKLKIVKLTDVKELEISITQYNKTLCVMIDKDDLIEALKTF